MTNDQDKGRHRAGFVDQTAKTKEAMKAIDAETVPRDFAGFVALYMRDRRALVRNELRVAQSLEDFNERISALETGLDHTGNVAARASGTALEHDATIGRLIGEVTSLRTVLEQHPAESKKVADDAACTIVKAGTDAGAEFAGLVADARASVKRWAWVVALVAGLVAGAGTWVGGRTSLIGVADEAAAKAVQDAPRPQAAERERIIFIGAAPMPSAVPTSGDH